MIYLEEKLLAKLNENLRRVKDDGTVNMECEQVVILETFARINIVRQEIGSNFNYFHNKISSYDRKLPMIMILIHFCIAPTIFP